MLLEHVWRNIAKATFTIIIYTLCKFIEVFIHWYNNQSHFDIRLLVRQNISQVTTVTAFNDTSNPSAGEARSRHRRDPCVCVHDAGIQVPDPDDSRRDSVRDKSPAARPPDRQGYDNSHDVPCDEHEYSRDDRWLDRKYCSNFVVGNSDGVGFREDGVVRKSNVGTKWLVGIDNTRRAILAWQNACLGCDCKEPRLLEEILPNPKLDAWKEGLLLPSK